MKMRLAIMMTLVVNLAFSIAPAAGHSAGFIGNGLAVARCSLALMPFAELPPSAMVSSTDWTNSYPIGQTTGIDAQSVNRQRCYTLTKEPQLLFL